jgi:hypothetical protein
MRVAEHESPAGKPAGPDRPENDQGQLSMYSENTSMYTDVPFKNEIMMYQIIEIEMYRYVPGTYRYIPFYDPEVVCTRFLFSSSSTYRDSKTNILARRNLF